MAHNDDDDEFFAIRFMYILLSVHKQFAIVCDGQRAYTYLCIWVLDTEAGKNMCLGSSERVGRAPEGAFQNPHLVYYFGSC